MPAPGRLFNPHRSLHSLLCMVALALMMRAMVPAGFMPRADAAHGGELSISFCTPAGGMATMSVDLGRQAPDAPPPHHASADCAFNLLSHQALHLFVPPAVWPVAIRTRELAQANAPRYVRLPSSTAGPPLGSRAPPVLVV